MIHIRAYSNNEGHTEKFRFDIKIIGKKIKQTYVIQNEYLIQLRHVCGAKEIHKRNELMKNVCSTIQFRCNSLLWLFIFEIVLQHLDTK